MLLEFATIYNLSNNQCAAVTQEQRFTMAFTICIQITIFVRIEVPSIPGKSSLCHTHSKTFLNPICELVCEPDVQYLHRHGVRSGIINVPVIQYTLLNSAWDIGDAMSATVRCRWKYFFAQHYFWRGFCTLFVVPNTESCI